METYRTAALAADASATAAGVINATRAPRVDPAVVASLGAKVYEIVEAVLTADTTKESCIDFMITQARSRKKLNGETAASTSEDLAALEAGKARMERVDQSVNYLLDLCDNVFRAAAETLRLQ